VISPCGQPALGPSTRVVAPPGQRTPV
jgi:hypothetical protein